MSTTAEWLTSLGMSEYAERFAENEIDIAVLRDLTDQDLKELGVSLGQRRLRRCRSDTGKLRNRTQHLPPMPERDTKLLEVVIGQVANNRGVNVALGKALRVLGHAERFYPIRNLLHRGPVAYASGWAVRGVYPTRHEIEGRFSAGLTFLPRFPATADKVIE